MAWYWKIICSVSTKEITQKKIHWRDILSESAIKPRKESDHETRNNHCDDPTCGYINGTDAEAYFSGSDNCRRLSHAGLAEYLRLYCPTGAGFTAVAGEQKIDLVGDLAV